MNSLPARSNDSNLAEFREERKLEGMGVKIAQLAGRIARRAFAPLSRWTSQRAFKWRRRHREYLARQWLFDTVAGFVAGSKVEGSYLEFGCAWGSSLIDMNDAMRLYREHDNTNFFIFDSFEGLPALGGLDAGQHARYEVGQFACDLDQFKRNVRRGGVNMARVQCIKGWYDKTLTPQLKQELPIEKAAIVLIDCDLYESTVPVLDFITDYIQTGTILIFDDWYSYKGRTDLGEALAFTEWQAKHPHIRATEYHKAGRTMISFIMQVEAA
jgi:hypothetical protein